MCIFFVHVRSKNYKYVKILTDRLKRTGKFLTAQNSVNCIYLCLSRKLQLDLTCILAEKGIRVAVKVIFSGTRSKCSIQNGAQNAEVRRKMLPEKVTLEHYRTSKYHRNPKIMCCVPLTSNVRIKVNICEKYTKTSGNQLCEVIHA